MGIPTAIMKAIISMSWCKDTLRRHSRCSSNWNLASFNLSHLLLEAKSEPILGSPLNLRVLLIRTNTIEDDLHLSTKTHSIPTHSWEAARWAKIITHRWCTTYSTRSMAQYLMLMLMLILIALISEALSIRTSHPLLWHQVMGSKIINSREQIYQL